MALEHGESSIETFLSKVQSATISALNARESGRRITPITFAPDLYRSVNAQASKEGHLRSGKDAIRLALKQLEAVTAGTMPIPVQRRPDIEPFFLP